MTLTKSQPAQPMHVHGTKADVSKAISTLPPKAQAVLSSFSTIDGGYISAQEVQEFLQKYPDITLQELMCVLVIAAQGYAYPPISNFKVGAVVHGISGALYFGANVEFVSEALSFCMHAEQAAITHAINYGETGIDYLAVSAAPCGYCRQFLYEITNSPTTKDITVLISSDPEKPYTSAQLSDLLPQAFGPGDLGVTTRLMEPQNNKLKMSPPPTDPVVVAALKAANYSYSPYTSDFAGVCIRTPNKTYVGAYAENAAYNPSSSPLEAALVMLLMNGESFKNINRAVLVEAANSKCSQLDATVAVLKSAAPSLKLEYHKAIVG